MPPNYNLLFQGGNAGEAFGQAFQKGMQQNQQNTAHNALSALAQDPTNKAALAALAKADPELALKFQSQQTEALKAHVGAHQENIIKGAQILRQFNPTDQQSYTQALAAAQAAGVDISQVPQQYDPTYVAGVIHVADALKPEAGTQDPGIIREFDIASQRGLVPQGTTYEQYVQMRNPGMSTPVTIPYGAQVMQGGGAPAASPMTATGPNGEKVQLNPQTGQWEPMGGAGGNVGGGFPGPH
jgi:hypothetical protein